MKLMTTAMAAIFAILYPFFLPWPDAHLARAGVDLSTFLSGPGKPALWAILAPLVFRATVLLVFGYAVAVCLLRLLKVSQYPDALTKRKNWMAWGLAGLAIYLLLLTVIFAISAVPYGGGRVPGGFHLLLLASWLAMAYGVGRALFQDLRAASRATASARTR